jgi:26S proteasome regulatory subunit T5
MASDLERSVWGEEKDEIAERMSSMSTDDLRQAVRALENEIRIMKSDIGNITHNIRDQEKHIKENKEKIKLNKSLPYLVANVVEIVEPFTDPDEDGGARDLTLVPECKGAVVKTSTRQTVFLPIPGLIRAEELLPGELVGTNKDSYIILEKLPTEFDSRVKAMEVDERPTEDYTDIGGLDKQIQELIEAIVLPMTHAEKFESIGIRAPKGVLLFGPPGIIIIY